MDTSEAEKLDVNSPPSPFACVRPWPNVRSKPTALRFRPLRGERGGAEGGRGEGGRKEKNRGRERKKNDLANFSYRVQGQWDNQCEAEAPPHLSPIHSPFKGIKGIRVQPLSL